MRIAAANRRRRPTGGEYLPLHRLSPPDRRSLLVTTPILIVSASRLKARASPMSARVKKGARFAITSRPERGTTVFWDFDLRPERCGIAAALFEQPFSPSPSYSAWEAMKYAWVPLPEGVVHFPENPAAPGTLQNS